jgi:hypothetical protein
VTLPDGSALGGVPVFLSGAQSRTTITDSLGNYRFDNVDTENFYTVTPALANFQFSPANRSFSLNGNKTDAMFTAVPDAIPTANVIDTSEYFARQQYLDFLGRDPDQGGFEYWSDQLRQCGGDASCLRQRRIDVSAAFFDSPEFQQTGSFVYRLYRGALGRQVSFAEFQADRRQVIAGPNLDHDKAALVAAFVERPEFVARYATSTTADTFVDALLRTLSGAGVDLSAERGNLLNRYNSAATMSESRSLVLREVSDNAAFTRAVYNSAFVTMEYFGYLQRDPDPGGYAFWLNVLDQVAPNNYRSMVCAFLTSVEYQRRFGTVITRSNAECGR